MTTICEPWSIVLVPRPLTPFAAFAWYVISELLPPGGLVRRKRYFRWVDGKNTRGNLFSPHGVILNLNAEKGIIVRELLAWLQCRLMLVGVPYDSNRKSRAVRDFVWCKKPKDRWMPLEFWFFDELAETRDPKEALKLSSSLFRKLVNEKIDPRREDFDLPWRTKQGTREPSLLDLPKIPGVRVLTMPVAKRLRKYTKSRRVHRQPVDYSIQRFQEKHIFRLCSEKVLLAVGGPTNSGKSTLVASLFVEMKNILEALVSREGAWKDLKIALDVANLDAATPVTDSVILRQGWNDRILTEIKREWTMELANEAVEEAFNKLRSANLVLADLPGEIDNITESLSAQVTFGGIITNDWSRIREWRAYFDSIGVPIVFELRSSTAQSLVTTYDPGESIRGRVYRLNRVVKGWDPFVRTLAEFLLFNILPLRVDQTVGFLKSLFATRRREDRQATVRFEEP